MNATNEERELILNSLKIMPIAPKKGESPKVVSRPILIKKSPRQKTQVPEKKELRAIDRIVFN